MELYLKLLPAFKVLLLSVRVGLEDEVNLVILFRVLVIETVKSYIGCYLAA